MLWAVFLVSTLIAFGVTELSIALSHRQGVLDVPNVRSSHSQPVPRLGGVGILAAALVSVALLALLRRWGFVAFTVLTRDVVVMLVTGMGMAATGLYDDFHGLRPGMKYLMQFLLAGLIVGFGYRIQSIALLQWGPWSLGVLSIAVTVVWITGFVNIFNFMDGINGISATTAAVYFAFFAVFAADQGSTNLVAVALALAGGCLGFLPLNFPKARTFMGDTGSLMLGMTLAFYVVRLAQLAPAPDRLVSLVLVCGVYLWDGGFTLMRRLCRGENIFQAHRSHLYQRLVQLGHSHARITILYLLLHMVMGGLALAYLRSGMGLRAAILAFAVMILAAFTVTVYGLERRGAKIRLRAGAAANGEKS